MNCDKCVIIVNWAEEGMLTWKMTSMEEIVMIIIMMTTTSVMVIIFVQVEKPVGGERKMHGETSSVAYFSEGYLAVEERILRK